MKSIVTSKLMKLAILIVVPITILALSIGLVSLVPIPVLATSADPLALEALQLTAPAQDAAIVQVVNRTSVNTDTTFAAQNWGSNTNLTSADIFFDITNASAVTVTAFLDVSPDGVSWFAHNITPTVVAANAATSILSYQNVAIHGQQYRIRLTVSSAAAIVPKIYTVLR